jgi:hypothetical protein
VSQRQKLKIKTMSPLHRALLSVEPAEALAPVRIGTRERAIFEELSFVRCEAQAEADAAYQDWCQRPGELGYAVYRAAQDRADAAQDDLAHLARRLVG